MTADANTPVLPVTDASARESFMYAQLALRGVDTNSIGTALTVELSKAWDTYLDGVRSEASAPAFTPPADDVCEALTKRVADEVEYRVRTAVTLAMNGYKYEQHVTQGRESVAAILAEVRPRGTVTEVEVEAAAQAMFDDTGAGDYTWAQVVTEDPSRADIWRADARRVLEAAREVHPYGTVTDAAALAKAWDEGFTLATRNSPNQPHPLAQSNPYRGEVRS